MGRIRPCTCCHGICPVVLSSEKLLVVTQMCWTGHWPCFNFRYGTVAFEQLEMKGMCTFHISVERPHQDMFIERISGWAAISSILLLYHVHCNVPHKQVVWLYCELGKSWWLCCKVLTSHHPLPCQNTSKWLGTEEGKVLSWGEGRELAPPWWYCLSFKRASVWDFWMFLGKLRCCTEQLETRPQGRNV